MVSLDLLTLEARSARVSAVLDARPELGALWRRIVSVSEASASLSMEDVPVPEEDILLPDIGSALISGDPQAARMAAHINTVLQRPGDILRAPADVFDRCIRAGRLTSLVDEEEGGRVASLSAEEQEDWNAAREDFIEAARQILRHRAPIAFRLLALAQAMVAIFPERLPIAERLIFMAAESALRREFCLSDPIVGTVVQDVDYRISAQWTLTPAMALSHGGFRAWSPASDTGIATLCARLDRMLGHNAGRLGQLHKWMGQMQGFTGQTRRSRRQDLAQLFLQAPVLGADVIADRLAITDRGARALLDEARSEGLVSLLTPRRAYRLWAVPAMAEMIRERPVSRATMHGALHADEKLETALHGEEEKPDRSRREENEAAIQSALDVLDKALARADQVLAKYQRQGDQG